MNTRQTLWGDLWSMSIVITSLVSRPISSGHKTKLLPVLPSLLFRGVGLRRFRHKQINRKASTFRKLAVLVAPLGFTTQILTSPCPHVGAQASLGPPLGLPLWDLPWDFPSGYPCLGLPCVWLSLYMPSGLLSPSGLETRLDSRREERRVWWTAHIRLVPIVAILTLTGV